MKITEKINNIKNVNYFYIVLLSFIAFSRFLFEGPTAYEWPAIDMVPFFERYFDSEFAPNDFYTNSISDDPSPRYVFGFIILIITKLLNTSWYKTLYAFKLIFVIFLPILYYLSIYSISLKYIEIKEKENTNKIKFLAFVSVFLILLPIPKIPDIPHIFSVAWWPPFFNQAAAQTLATFLSFLSIIIKEFDLRIYFISSNLISIFLFGLATLVHPAVGLFSIVFYLVSDLKNLTSGKNSNIKYHALNFSVAFLIPSLLLKSLFKSEISLPTKDFINIYVMNHSGHYYVSDLGSLTPYNWKLSFLIIIFMMIVPGIYFAFLRKKYLLSLSIAFLVSYVMALFLQYIFIEEFPSKIVATIGFTRYTAFGYWMISILWIAMLSNVRCVNSMISRYVLRKLDPIKNLFFRLNYLIFFLVIFFIIGLSFIDSPRNSLYNESKAMYDFIETTPEDSVFATYFGNYKMDLPFVSRRSLFIGNGFPFNEKHFYEFQDRNGLLYGSYEEFAKINGRNILEKYVNYFRNSDPKKFYEISKIYKLDFVIIESKYDSLFTSFKPIFEDSKVKIYRVSELSEIN